jgi:perosamine synthetase
VDRDRFLKAMAAEGVALSPYIERGLHREPWVDHVIQSRVYRKTFSERRLKEFRAAMDCPKCDQVCQEMAMIWASGPLLGTKEDMDDIANALLKVYENRSQLAST